MSKYLVIACMLGLMMCTVSSAQGLRGKRQGTRRGPAALRQSNDDSTNKRQDVEGTIWEFKVLEPKEKDPAKQLVMSGKIRIKQSSIFAVSKPKLMKEQEKGAANPAANSGSKGEPDVRGQFKSLMSQRINQSQDQTSGGERIGDIAKAIGNKYQYEFDQDDKHPLSGLVDVAPDPEKKNGVWAGNYEEFAGGKRVKRWRFEMRKVEE